MIIANAQIAMLASHDYREDHQINEKLDFSLTPKIAPTLTQGSTSQPRWTEQVNISARGLSLLELQRNRQSLNLNTQMDSHSRVNLMILQHLYEAITGHAMHMIDPSKFPTSSGDESPMLDVDTTPPAAQASAQAAAPISTAGYSLIYQRQEHYQEQEKLQFKAEGIVRTQDGRELAFSSSLSMSRDYAEDSNIVIRGGDAKKVDPLVINFDGKGAQLSQTRFKFDLDNDGTEEQIASLRSGSGFLALDRNGDGIINNGSELFGPGSGQGFAELAKFDEDGNHFIDEGDSIYNKLRIWSFNEDGSSQLVALGDKQIGAIFLGHVTSPFQLKDDKNQSLGEVANSGIYLKENGEAGAVQEINLTAQEINLTV